MAQRKDVSIQMIAEQCGVSTATVSRVLNSDPKVAEATRQRVLAVLRESGYRPPVPSAGGVKKVGMVFSTQSSDYYWALSLQLQEALTALGIQTVSASLGRREERLPGILRTIYDCNVCGVVLIACGCMAVKDLLDPRLPHVWIDCNDPPEETGGICQVQSDQRSSGILAAQELYRKGSRRPILLGGQRVSHRMRERFGYFQAEYRKHGIELGEDRIILTPGIREALEESKQAIRYLITTDYEFDGIFAISDWRALGSYLALSELGIRVPEDVRIIGYDGVSVANRTVLNITAIRQDIGQIARHACDLLLCQMDHRPIEKKQITVPTSILTGQTL